MYCNCIYIYVLSIHIGLCTVCTYSSINIGLCTVRTDSTIHQACVLYVPTAAYRLVYCMYLQWPTYTYKLMYSMYLQQYTGLCIVSTYSSMNIQACLIHCMYLQHHTHCSVWCGFKDYIPAAVQVPVLKFWWDARFCCYYMSVGYEQTIGSDNYYHIYYKI